MTRKNKKGKRFEALISRADDALELQFYLEASWIIYSLIEERLKSVAIDKLSLPMNRENFHSCVEALEKERKTNSLIEDNFEATLLPNLDDWRLKRNNIMHDLAKEDIDYEKIKELAISGRSLFAQLATSIMKLKKQLK